MKFKRPMKFDISSYRLIVMSDVIKAKRGPFELQKIVIRGDGDKMGYFVWDNTYYDDEKLIGTRVISHYYVKGRSVVFQ